MGKRQTIELGDYCDHIIDVLIERGVYKNQIEALRDAVRIQGEKYGVTA